MPVLRRDIRYTECALDGAVRQPPGIARIHLGFESGRRRKILPGVFIFFTAIGMLCRIGPESSVRAGHVGHGNASMSAFPTDARDAGRDREMRYEKTLNGLKQ
jgi:hypothetical protein